LCRRPVTSNPSSTNVERAFNGNAPGVMDALFRTIALPVAHGSGGPYGRAPDALKSVRFSPVPELVRHSTDSVSSAASRNSRKSSGYARMIACLTIFYLKMLSIALTFT